MKPSFPHSEAIRPFNARRTRLIVFALGLSEPGTMGGNSKIAIEAARCLASRLDVHFVIPRHKLPTLSAALGDVLPFKVHPLDDYPVPDKYHPFSSVRHYVPLVRSLFCSLKVGPADIVFGMSDFHIDVLPLHALQPEFGFLWLPSVFLFVPSLLENLRFGYGFPCAKYFVYWMYQRWLFGKMKRRASAFVVTNDTDRRHFPARFKDLVFAYYGGVNVEQIPSASEEKTRDVVFCSRLHPPKGIDGFLDVWKIVRTACPSARFTVIGNGEPGYEVHLKAKASRLGIGDSIDWLGYVNNEAKYAIYASARVFVHPTVFDNNGMVAAEALCSGLPVVMFDLPQLRDVYTVGCTKVPPGNKAAFAAEVARLLSEPSYHASVAPTASQVADLRARWDWPHRAERFLAFLEGLP